MEKERKNGNPPTTQILENLPIYKIDWFHIENAEILEIKMEKFY